MLEIVFADIYWIVMASLGLFRGAWVGDTAHAYQVPSVESMIRFLHHGVMGTPR
jgi:hypothetical protein